MFQEENFITRLNYDPRATGFLSMAVFGAITLSLSHLERGAQAKSLPLFMRGRLFDTIGPLTTGSLGKVLTKRGDLKTSTKFAILPHVADELILQNLGLSGVFDWGDFGAYGIGTLGWIGFELSAKLLHDSGLTLPIYRFLHIKHKKFG